MSFPRNQFLVFSHFTAQGVGAEGKELEGREEKVVLLVSIQFNSKDY